MSQCKFFVQAIFLGLHRTGRRRFSCEISSTTNKTNFHEWGAASPGNFILGLIRVHSFYSWFKTSTDNTFLTKVDVFEISLTTNKTNFHEWGAASPGNFILGLIRVHSFYSWFKPQRTTRF
jgi:phage protein U